MVGAKDCFFVGWLVYEGLGWGIRCLSLVFSLGLWGKALTGKVGRCLEWVNSRWGNGSGNVFLEERKVGLTGKMPVEV